MLNKILRVVLGIIIAAAVLVGVYFILPGQYKYPITEKLQDMTKSYASIVVGEMKNLKVPDNDITFGSMMAKYASPAWTLDDTDSVDDLGNGSMTVYADAYKCTVQMDSEMADDKLITFTNAHVRLIFKIVRTNGALEKVTLEKIVVNETEYDQNSPYYQRALNSMCK